MRAISFAQHGTPDVLQMIEIDLPVPGVNDVLVRNHAIGKDTFDMSLACLRKRGMMVIYGQSSGAVPPFDVNRLSGITPNSSRGSLFLTWAALSHYVEARADLLEHARAVFDRLAAGQLKPAIAARLPLANAAEAHRLLEARQVMGKLLLMP